MHNGKFETGAAFRILLIVLLTAAAASAQQEISRNKGITVERPGAAPSAEARQAAAATAVPPQVCDGANYTTNTFNDGWSMGGPIVAIAWTPAATITISRIEVFTGESTGPIALGVWNDDGGSPNSKPLADLGDTGYFPISTTDSWQGKDLATSVTVIGGAKYWIVFDPSGGEQAPIQNGTGQQYWGSYTGTISSVPPADWFGPFSFSDHAWKFRVFCVPPPRDVYAVKFLCGNFTPKSPTPAPDGVEWPVKPGNYLTAINVHNPNGEALSFRKKAVMLYRGDKPPEPEEPMPPGNLLEATLRPDWGLEIDCSDIRRKLLGGMAPDAPTFIKGWVVIEVSGAPKTDPRPLDVTAVYTAHGWDLSGKMPAYAGFAEDVEPVRPTRIKP